MRWIKVEEEEEERLINDQLLSFSATFLRCDDERERVDFCVICGSFLKVTPVTNYHLSFRLSIV